MGCYGSGRRYEAKRRVEQSIALSISWLLQNNYLDLGVGQRGYNTITGRGYRGELRYTLTVDLERLSLYQMRLYLGNTDQVVCLNSTALHFGGVRWWFRCLASESVTCTLLLNRSAHKTKSYVSSGGLA